MFIVQDPRTCVVLCCMPIVQGGVDDVRRFLRELLCSCDLLPFCAVIVLVIQIVIVVDNIPIEIVIVIGIIVVFRVGIFIMIIVGIIMYNEIIFAFGRGEPLGRIRIALVYSCSCYVRIGVGHEAGQSTFTAVYVLCGVCVMCLVWCMCKIQIIGSFFRGCWRSA